MVDEDCQVLQHSKHWIEVIDPSIIAMDANVLEIMKGSTNAVKKSTEYLSHRVDRHSSNASSVKPSYLTIIHHENTKSGHRFSSYTINYNTSPSSFCEFKYNKVK